MRRTIEFTSVLFVDHFTGGILLLFSVGGSLVCLSRRAKNVIPLAILNLIAWLMFLFTGLIITYVADHYVGPSPRDFELFYYPLYSLFAAYAFIFIVQKSRDILSSALSPNRTSKTYALDSWFPTGLLLAVVLLLYSLSPIGRGATGFEWPMQDTVLGNKLVSSIGLGGGGRYNGTVVTITRKGLPESAVSWADQVGVDCAYTRRVGNDFRALGLWRLNVSTVFAYNQLITPQFYAMTTRFLSRPIDPQIRNVVTLTNLNIDYLASLGVRYAIVDGYVPNLHEDITNGKIIPLPEFNFSGDNYPGYLYEIQKPNIGTFYPVHQVVTSSGEEAAAIMSDPSMPFNYQNSVVVTERIPEPLVTADPAVLTFKRDGLHIKAHSNGTSILLLPLQYSHCLSIKTISVGAVKPKIVRANVMQVALLFSGTVELVVSFRYGPFENQFGRIKDFLDMQKLGIDAIAFIKTKS